MEDRERQSAQALEAQREQAQSLRAQAEAERTRALQDAARERETLSADRQETRRERDELKREIERLNRRAEQLDARGDKLDALEERLEEGLRALSTQEAELAERAGITRKSINAIEAGHMVPSTILALKLSKVLGVTVEELFSLASPEA